MKFLVDAHLPKRMAEWFTTAGFDAIHTLEMPDKNETTDAQIVDHAEQDQRIVVTKDSDFVDSHLLSSRPQKLLLISTGNISNRELEQLFVPLLSFMATNFQSNSFIEFRRDGIVIRG